MSEASFEQRHGSNRPYWKDVGIAAPGQVVHHDGKIWVCTYDRYVTQTLSHEPGYEEDFSMWRQLDSHLWRESPVPVVRRRGWRKKCTDRLLAVRYLLRIDNTSQLAHDAGYWLEKKPYIAPAVLRQIQEGYRKRRALDFEAHRLQVKLGLSSAAAREMSAKHFRRHDTRIRRHFAALQK